MQDLRSFDIQWSTIVIYHVQASKDTFGRLAVPQSFAGTINKPRVIELLRIET